MAKNVMQVHGVDDHGRAVLKKQLKRAQMLPFFVNLVPCKIGMEACGSAHYWARKLQALGHTVQLIPPQCVKPFVKRNKNDAADAEAICEAVMRPNMPAVPVKNASQQAILSVHRARQGFVKARTAQANQIRGLLAEYGIAIPQGIGHIAKRIPEILEDGENDLPGSFRALLRRLADHLKELDRQVGELEVEIQLWHRESDASDRREINTVGHQQAGRHLSADLVDPRCPSIVRIAENRPNADPWLKRLLARRNKNVAAVALANKNARTLWALLAHDREYLPDYRVAP